MNETNSEKSEMQAKSKAQRKAVTLSPELLEFVNSPLSTAEIAARYGISPATLTVRAKKAGLPLRKRGRRLLKEPTAHQKKILAFATIHGCQRAALRFEMTKQRVNTLQHRWESWVALNIDCGPKATTLRKANQYTVRFRLGPDCFNQLKKLLRHPWFSRLESTNQAAREIVSIFLSGEIRSLKSKRIGTF